MMRNEGRIDRIVRLVLIAPLAVITAFVVGPGSVVGVIALVVAAMMVITAVTGFCPIYRLLGLDTRPESERKVTSRS